MKNCEILWGRGFLYNLLADRNFNRRTKIFNFLRICVGDFRIFTP